MSDLRNNAPQIVARLARTHYVVLVEVSGKLTPILDPGLNAVWRGQGVFGRKMGDEIVKDCAAEGMKASVMTWEDALRLLTKQCGGESAIERQLLDRIVAKNQQRSSVKLPPK